MVFRCDGSETIGLGHVSRCLALAQRFAHAGAHCVFASRELPDRFRRRLGALGFGVHAVGVDDSHTTAGLAGDEGVVVTDSHLLGTDYYGELVAAVRCVISFDDIAGCYYPSDVVVNPNVGADQLSIEAGDDTIVLRGPAYLPLREEFDRYRVARRTNGDVRNAVISLGGMPETEIAIPMARAMARVHVAHGVRTTIVAGLSADADQLSAITQAIGGAGQVVVDGNIAALLGEADFAIVNASTTALEAAALAVPAMVIEVAANQHAAAEAYRRTCNALVIDRRDPEQSAYSLACALIVDPSLRYELSQKGQALVDGQGHHRILDALGKRLSGNTRSNRWNHTH